jgi:nitroreductase
MATDGGPLYNAIRTRRVSRSMTGEPVSPGDLELVVNAARFAPNAGNRRLQPMVPISDPVVIGMLRKVAPGMLPVPAALIVICIDEPRALEYGFRAGTPGLYIDVGTTAATLLLAAHTIGLASCPVTSFSRAAVARILGLADGIIAQMFVALGHATPDQPPPMPASGLHP